MATLARDTLNGILQQITGVNGGTVQNLSSPTQAYGYDGSGLYVTLGANAAKTYVSTADQAVDKGVLWALPQTQVIGGDIFLKRALDDTAAAPDVTTLLGNLQVASDYEFYTNNRALINAEITAAYATLTSAQMSFYNSNKALVDQVDSQGVSSLNSSQASTYNANASTIGTIIQALQAQSVANPWIITLQRADELGLDRFQTSDFYGGLKGFMGSFTEGGKSIRYEDFGLSWDGNGLTVADTANTATVFDLPQASANASSVYIANFLSTMGYTPQANGAVSNGNDLDVGAPSVNSWNTGGSQGGNDIFVGTGGNDWIAAGTGSSWVDGGAGDDTLADPGGSCVLLGGAGNDTIQVGASTSTAGTYYLSGGAGNDTLTASAGTATFVGGTGNDKETGGSGKNTYIADPSNLTSYSNSSTLVIQGSGNYNTLSFERYTAPVSIDLRSGDTTHSDGPNHSQQAGMQQVSTDTFAIQSTNITISDVQNLTGGAGNDFLCNTAAMTSVLNGGAGNDFLAGWGVNNTLEGGPGTDTIDGFYGVNTVTYEGSSAGVYVNLATGTAYGGDADGDLLQGSLQNLTGSAYNDTLQANYGGVLVGNAGDDTLLYSGGYNSYNGGDGFDTVDYSSAASGVTVNLAGGANGGAAATDNFSSIEQVIGSRYNDTLTASSIGSTFEGGGGTDTFNGGSASDTYILGRGDGYATVNDNNTASNTLQIGPGLGFDDLWFATSGGSSGYLAVGIRQAGGAQTGDELYVPGNFGAYPLSADNIIKDLNLNGSSSIDISQVTFVSGGTGNADTLSGPSDSTHYSFLIGYEGNDNLSSTQNGQLTQDGTIFLGGTGTDRITASSGNNEFLFERGDGTDVVTLTGGQNTLIFGSTVSASDVIYQVDSSGDLFIGLRSTTNPSLTASQVSDYVEVVGGAIETQNLTTGTNTYSASIQTVEAGGTTINLQQVGIPYLIKRTSQKGGVQQPVVLDLKGDGLEVSSVASSDIGTVDGNGVVTRMSWVGPTDGILVTDRDGTGRYNTTEDISFVQDKPGATSDLQGLQAWDTNADGVLNAQDTDWDKLKVWVDANQDGVAQAGEVETLAQAGVTSISLNETPSGFDPTTTFDSYYTGTASFTRTDGSTGTAYDEALARRFLDQTTDAQSGGESWAQLTPDATIGQLQSSTGPAAPSTPSAASASAAEVAPASLATTLASGVTAFTTSAAQAAKSGGTATINTLGSNKISSQDATLWSDVLNPVPGQLHAAPGTFLGAQNLAAIQTSTAHPAGYDELTGRSSSTSATTRNAEPIVLDLAGLGLSQIAPTASSVSFDAAHTGTPQTVGWIGGGEAILAYDLNGDGKVDPSTEITFKPDVAVATDSLGGLASFDTDANGYLDPGDAGWSKFLVWRDVNGDGISDPGETETLIQAGVARLALTPTTTTPDNGDPSTNEVMAQSAATLSNGSIRTAYDVALGVKGAPSSTSSTSAGTAPSPTSTAAASATPAVKATAVPRVAAATLTAQAASTSATAAGGDTSVARAAEDGPQTPQGAQYVGTDDTGAVSGWWSAPSSNTGSVLGPSGVAGLSFGGTGPSSNLAAPISAAPDAATLQQQQLLRQSLASFTAPTSNSSAVWTRQPAADLIPTLAAAAAKPLASQTAAFAAAGG